MPKHEFIRSNLRPTYEGRDEQTVGHCPLTTGPPVPTQHTGIKPGRNAPPSSSSAVRDRKEFQNGSPDRIMDREAGLGGERAGVSHCGHVRSRVGWFHAAMNVYPRLR